MRFAKKPSLLRLFPFYSMYTKALLERYAETIGNADERREFTRVAETIQFDRRGFCPGKAPEVAFFGTSVDHLRVDFENRFMEFLRNEDFPGLQTASVQE